MVSKYHCDGEATIEYVIIYANNATERLTQFSGMQAHQERAKTLPPFFQSPSCLSTQVDAKQPKYCLSSPHTAKAFTDDLSVFSSNISNHQSLLLDLSNDSRELDLTLRPDKCISLVFDGKRMESKTTFSLAKWLHS